MLIYLIDLTHETKLGLGSDTMPLQLGLIGAYCIKEYGPDVEVEIFKSVTEFTKAVERRPPHVIASSNYMWNIELGYKLTREIKKDHPKIVVVFGGPNYPDTKEEQLSWLKEHPAVDFYIYKDGEIPFSKLIGKLLEGNGVEEIKMMKLPSCHSVLNGAPFFGELEPRLKDLSLIPSPYTTGLMDKFFEEHLIPPIQTNRGCPFTCTFCTEGGAYYSSVSKTKLARKKAELDYIAGKVKHTKTLRITDSNFGMYEEDEEFCGYISEVQKKSGYPEYITCSTGKNNKERVLRCNEMVGNIMRLTASVQSLDPEVLKAVKRVNISTADIMKLSEKTSDTSTHSYSEMILALPGDSLKKEIFTMKGLIDTGIGNITQHQLALIYGTEMASPKSRKEYEVKSMFRPIQRCVGRYRWKDREIVAIEVEEVCVGTKTLSAKDYLAARKLYLTLGLFYNDRIFGEIVALFRYLGISAWDWLLNVHKKALNDKKLKTLYRNFSKETMGELWEKQEVLREAVGKKLDTYMSGEAGGNLIYKYRVLGTLWNFTTLHKIAFSELRKVLRDKESPALRSIINSLETVSYLSKKDPLYTKAKYERKFDYDVLEILENTVSKDGMEKLDALKRPTAVKIEHTEEQKEIVKRQSEFYGGDLGGLTMLISRFPIKRFYRKVTRK